MFYNDTMLTRKGPLAHIWMAAHYEKKLTRHQIVQTNIEDSVRDMVEGSLGPMALRLSGQLLLGVTKIYGRKTRYLLDDCSESLDRLRMSLSKSKNGGEDDGDDIDSYAKLLNATNSNSNATTTTNSNANSSNITLPAPTLNQLNSVETPELDLDALLRGAVPLPTTSTINTTGFTQAPAAAATSLDSIEYARRESGRLSFDNSPHHNQQPQSPLNPLNFSSEIEFARRQSGAANAGLSSSAMMMMSMNSDDGSGDIAAGDFDALHYSNNLTSSPQSKLALGLKMVSLDGAGVDKNRSIFGSMNENTNESSFESAAAPLPPKIKRAKRNTKHIKLDRQTTMNTAIFENNTTNTTTTNNNNNLLLPAIEYSAINFAENPISAMLEDDVFLLHRHIPSNLRKVTQRTIIINNKQQRQTAELDSIIDYDDDVSGGGVGVEGDFDEAFKDPSLTMPASPFGADGGYTTTVNNNLQLWKTLECGESVRFTDFVCSNTVISFTPIEPKKPSKKLVSSLFMDLLVLKTNGHVDLATSTTTTSSSILLCPKKSLYELETI